MSAFGYLHCHNIKKTVVARYIHFVPIEQKCELVMHSSFQAEIEQAFSATLEVLSEHNKLEKLEFELEKHEFKLEKHEFELGKVDF